MKAAVLHAFKTPLVIEDVPRPSLSPDDLLIAVEACGVCHSDVHVAQGDWPQLAPIVKKPLILGHEVTGRVVETGANVRELRVGDRVGVPWIFWTCGACEFCREGHENLCANQKITGVSVDGGYAEFLKAPASHATKIPDALSSMEAAPLFCAGVTVYRALQKATILAGQRVAIFGVGGLGHLALQMAAGLGGQVIAIDVSEEKLALAESLGATETCNAAGAEVEKKLRRLGAHVALVTSAAKSAYDLAFSCLRPTGTLLVVGLPAENICFPPILMAALEINVHATAVGTRQDLRAVLALAAAGKLRPQVIARPLCEANAVLEALRQGKISGRVVLTP
jgi:alcohol dehydrogenase, propanol-preferring